MFTQTAQTDTLRYSSFVTHNEDLIEARARLALAMGDGMGWGRVEHTLEEAAEDMGAIVYGTLNERLLGLLCEVSETLYLLCDAHGPFAVEVASQRDLGQ